MDKPVGYCLGLDPNVHIYGMQCLLFKFVEESRDYKREDNIFKSQELYFLCSGRDVAVIKKGQLHMSSRRMWTMSGLRVSR